MYDKEAAYKKYIDMVKASWTFDRLTEEEKKRLLEALKFTKLSGTFRQRWETLQAVNYGFLLGVGYKSIGWREPEESPLF